MRRMEYPAQSFLNASYVGHRQVHVHVHLDLSAYVRIWCLVLGLEAEASERWGV